MNDDCAEVLDLLRPGMRLYVAGSVSEPRTLLRAAVARPEVFRGVHVTTSFVPGLNQLAGEAFAHAETVQVLMAGPQIIRTLGGRLRYIPMPWSQASTWLASQAFDMVWLQVAAPRSGVCSLGLGADFAAEVTARAQRVVLEVCDVVPFTRGHDPLVLDDRTILVRGVDGPFRLEAAVPDETALRIANHVGQLVRDGDTLQLGVGKLMGAAARALKSHKNLGIHSGVVGDEVMELVACGAADGSRKAVDPGLLITAGVAGSEPSYTMLRDRAPVEIRPSTYTHDPAILAAQDRLVALNGAVEVDLRGQVNVEWAAGRRVSSPGGFTDFIRGAQLARSGRAVVLLQATAPDGRSRVIPTLGTPAVTSALDALTVVTEFGIADLRWRDERERAALLISIAAPQHRDSLAASAHSLGLL